MARLPNIFSDPQTGTTYQWALNHSEEQPVARSRQITDGAPTGNIGLLPQQGPRAPLKFQWKGTILTYAQLVQMIFWFELCESRSIYLTDFSGAQYEILIEEFTPTRKGVAANKRDLVNAPGWIWEYTMTFRVITVLSGEWLGTTP